MSYLSLARKYRPRRFADMVGQEAITLALTNAIRLRREAHSVIFTGVRGVGKTTTARIYAKALNCEQGPKPDPCDQCASCLAIQDGAHEDVLEIDGASNTGVDDIRALQETLAYVPQRSSFKVYIIDEVHMLSISAFNALLKTLEEPPEHVVFIFATTELQKVPETILSRCQTFHLQKIARTVIIERLQTILLAEGIAYDLPSLSLLAREGRGSLRDALTLLDQAIALGGGAINAETLRHVIGNSQAIPILGLLSALLRHDAKAAMEHIARWDQEGLALASLVEELAKTCRNAFILRDIKGAALDLQILELEANEQQSLQEIASQAVDFDLNRLFRSCVKCLDDLRHTDLDRFVVENYALEWCLDPGLPDFQGLLSQAPLMAGPSAAGPQVKASSSEAGLGLKDRWKQSQQAPVPSKLIEPETPRPPPMPTHLAAQSAQLETNARGSTTLLKGPPPPVGPSRPRPLAPPPPPVMAPASERAVHLVSAPLENTQRATAVEVLASYQPSSNLQKAEALAQALPEALSNEGVDPPKSAPSLVKEAEPELPGAIDQPLPKVESGADICGSQGQIDSIDKFPATWREFVEGWKKAKPLQARVLEETYVIEYGPDRIKLAVDPQSMAGGKLLQIDMRKRFLAQFEQLFAYRGLLEVVVKDELKGKQSPVPEQIQESLGESLLEVKQREREVAREQLRHSLAQHPLTREVISAFDGTIETIDLP